MAMQARTLTRTLLVSAVLAVASSAMAQATDKDRPTTAKPSTAKSSKPAAATKRLDFVPSSNIKETGTRPATPGANTQAPGQEGWHCDHSGASDA
jgi:hypothetical protein